MKINVLEFHFFFVRELENLLKHSQYGGASEEELEEMKMKMRSALSKLSAKEDELKKALDALNATKVIMVATVNE